MLLLAVDTTTPAGSVAILKGASILAEININSSLTFSERLLPAIHFLIQNLGLNIQEVDAFALAVGPGSFTGIRIGVSTVKSLARASGKPVAPISSLEALAFKLQNHGGRLVCPFIDAKKGEVYAALFESANKRLREVNPQGAYAPDDFLSRLPSNRIISFLGSGVSVYRREIRNYLKDKARFSSRSLFIAREVGLLGYQRIKNNEGIPSWSVEPLYFRKSQAEENH